MSNCALCSVRNRSICSALDSTEIVALSAISRQRTLAAGESLAWEGEDSVLLANVIAGILSFSSAMPDGREQIVGMVYPADFIGRPFGGATPYSVTALTEARVCVFSRNDFDRLARQHSLLEHKLLERTLQELDRARRWMLLLGRKNAEEKLATFLLELSARLVERGCEYAEMTALDRIELPFTRQQIADVLGLTIETVSRQFSMLAKQAVIALPSHRDVVILDRLQLEFLAN